MLYQRPILYNNSHEPQSWQKCGSCFLIVTGPFFFYFCKFIHNGSADEILWAALKFEMIWCRYEFEVVK